MSSNQEVRMKTINNHQLQFYFSPIGLALHLSWAWLWALNILGFNPCHNYSTNTDNRKEWNTDNGTNTCLNTHTDTNTGMIPEEDSSCFTNTVTLD